MGEVSTTPRVALALGSGGARGYAHIGIIEAIRERGWEVVGIAGTSMGALVGGLAAAGQLDPYTEWVRGLSQRDVWRLLDPSLRTPGALRGEKIMAEVRSLIGETRIEDLDIPFTTVAIDLVTHREVWFQRGPLDAAIRASIALPTVFTPVMLDGRLLVDGGMLNPVPMAPLSALACDRTIAVDLSGPPRRAVPATPPASEPALEKDASAEHESRAAEWRTQLTRHLDDLRETEAVRKVAGWFERSSEEHPTESSGGGFSDLPAGLGYRDVMTMTYEAMQDVIARYREASYPADLMIRVPRDAAHTLDFHRGAELVDLGRELAEEAFAECGW